MSGRTAALAAEDVWKRYGRDVWALSGVSLEIPWGRVTALVGPNAAGKSTLIKTWVGFERPTRGRVFVANNDPWTARAKTSAMTAYLSQTPALYRELTVGEHLDLCAHYRPGFDRLEAVTRLARLGLRPEVKVGNLSGGQVAQVGLAIALSTRASILLLDEPLASLDPLARREFLDVMKEGVRRAEATALLSSHVVSDVEHAADWLVVLGVGRKLLDLSLDDARQLHRVVAPGRQGDDEVVAELPGSTGLLVRVERDRRDGVPASTEDVVMGYLSKGRTGDSSPGAERIRAG